MEADFNLYSLLVRLRWIPSALLQGFLSKAESEVLQIYIFCVTALWALTHTNSLNFKMLLLQKPDTVKRVRLHPMRNQEAPAWLLNPQSH